MRASLKTGALLAAVTVAIETIAILPGRTALAREQERLGRSATEVLVAGTLRDLSDIAMPIGLVVAIAIAIAVTVRWSRGPGAVRTATVRTLTPLLSVIALLLWFTSAGAAEFKVQRGVDATWFDVTIAAEATSVWRTTVGFFWCRRHLVPGALAFMMIGAIFVVVRRRARSWPMKNRPALLAGFAGATVLAWVVALIPLDPHVRVFKTIGDRHIVGEPFVDLFVNFGHSQENVRLGMRSLIEHADFPAEKSRGGEALLGVPTPTSGTVNCAVHPMARSLIEDGVEPPRPSTTGHHALDPEAATVLRILGRLSAELYAGRTTPIDVWQVMLESFRGEDIHAITPAAPRAVAPFMNSLYESAERGDGSVIAIRRMWQAGSRTSQGLSSYMCGLGMMPYGLSVTRDFGSIPLRCVPDVLIDAGYDPSFLYGGSPSFDEMDPFLRNHGFTDIIGHLMLPRDAPTSQEGVSDRALYAWSIDRAARTARARARYHLVMSGTNHIPFGRPTDVPPEVDARVNELVQSPAFIGSPDDTARVRTFAYADHALSELVGNMGPALARTVFFLGADHATGDPHAWADPDRNEAASYALIPYAIVLPDALIAGSARPDAVRALVRELNGALDHHAWSEDDVPMFLLALLSSSPGMLGLPPEKRWHTIGGERTSPYFTSLRPDAKVIGVNSVSDLFAVDESDHSLVPNEKASFVHRPADIYTTSPSLIPVAAAMSRFLSGYASACKASRAQASR